MDLVIRGNKIIIGIIAIILLIDVVVLASSVSLYALSGNIGYATPKIVQGLIRLLLEIGISYNLYKGNNWAKWVLVVLLALGGLISLVSVIPIFSVITIFGVVYFLLGIVYVVICVILIASRSVKEFMRYQKVGDISSYDNSIDNTNEPFFKPESDETQ